MLGVGIVGPATAQSIGVGTMSQGTMSYSTGSAIAKVITEKAKVQARVQPNTGETVLIPLVNTGELNFGISNVMEAADAVTGQGAFNGRKLPDLRLSNVLYPLKTGIFVRKDSPIKTIADLKGKRLSYGYTATASVRIILDGILANGGLTPADIRPVLVPNVARGAEEFASGNADAFFFAVGAAKVTEVDAQVSGLRMLPLSTEAGPVAAMRKIFPYGYAIEVKPRPGLAGIVQPTPAMSYDNVLLVSVKEKDDDVYKVVKAIAENKADLVSSFAPFNDFDVAQMHKPNLPVAFHPGALRYYKERGFIK
jgi:TRAP transporter TAXI family solute receptor